jgi:LSD1 subclass zinc finger protein
MNEASVRAGRNITPAMSLVRCDHCGAPLELADGTSTVRCGYCQKDQVVTAMMAAVERPAARPAASVERYTRGRPVLCEWRGRWWPATILAELPGGQYLIHYDGYSSSWDETVGLERLAARSAKVPRATGNRAVGMVIAVSLVVAMSVGVLLARQATSSSAPPATMAPAVMAAPGQLALGQPVKVLWSGRWWNATVIAVYADGRVRVHYDGWAASWDEDVTLDRVGLR